MLIFKAENSIDLDGAIGNDYIYGFVNDEVTSLEFSITCSSVIIVDGKLTVR